MIYKQNPVAKTINEVRKHRPVFAYKMYNPAYNFYLDSTIQKFNDTTSLKTALQHKPGAIVISREDDAADLNSINLKLVARHRDIFESPTTVVYVVNR